MVDHKEKFEEGELLVRAVIKNHIWTLATNRLAARAIHEQRGSGRSDGGRVVLLC